MRGLRWCWVNGTLHAKGEFSWRPAGSTPGEVCLGWQPTQAGLICSTPLKGSFHGVLSTRFGHQKLLPARFRATCPRRGLEQVSNRSSCGQTCSSGGSGFLSCCSLATGMCSLPVGRQPGRMGQGQVGEEGETSFITSPSAGQRPAQACTPSLPRADGVAPQSPGKERQLPSSRSA